MELYDWLERVYNLRRYFVKQEAARRGLRPVHTDILEYLANCNQHSNGPLAVAEYLGQTKGSVSRSIKLLQDRGLVGVGSDPSDLRLAKLFLTPAGSEVVEVLRGGIPTVGAEPALVEGLKSLLEQWQAASGRRGFGVCQTCRFHQALSESKFRCGLTGEELEAEQAVRLCREHDAARQQCDQATRP